MNAHRAPFREVLPQFTAFLKKEGKSTDLLWVTKEQIRAHKSLHWVYKVEQNKEKESEDYYNSRRESNTSLRLDAVAQAGGKTVCWVEDYGGDSGSLNFGIYKLPHECFIFIKSPILWALLRFINRRRGQRVGFARMNITTEANKTEVLTSEAAPHP